MRIKICTSCKKEKSFSDFSINKIRKDGLCSRCKGCTNTYSKRWYSLHRKEHLSHTKEWHVLHREYHLNSLRNWYINNRLYLLKKGKKYYKEHREEHMACIQKRSRQLGWVQLYPNPFSSGEKIAWHHIDDIYVVAVPLDLHYLYYEGRNTSSHRDNLLPIVNQIYGEIACA